MKYIEANELLSGRCHRSRKLANNTYLIRLEDSDSIAIRLHQTDIIRIDPNGDTSAFTGGWRTVTTKARLNEYLPVGIYQEAGVWYWKSGEAFSEGDKIDINGKLIVVGDSGGNEAARVKALVKRINGYAAKCADAVPLPQPSGGDCWACLGMPLGGNDHLESHIEEGYIVPSLVGKALKESGCGDLVVAGAFVQAESMGWVVDVARDQVKRSVRKFLKVQYGIAR